MEEYDRLDADYYDYYSTGLEGDVEFYVAEAQKAGSPVLELGCGTGRITFPIAQAGVSIVGLDLSPSMLGVARRKLTALDLEVQSRVKLVAGDMRDFSLRRSRWCQSSFTPKPGGAWWFGIPANMTLKRRWLFSISSSRI
jgi:ubiquinone/menaquinone biosynthesis C-methylase UbiE